MTERITPIELVIDANILFAALIKEGTTKEILLTRTPSPLKLCSPSLILQETYNRREFLSKKMARSEMEVMRIVLELISLANIEIIKTTDLDPLKIDAESISPSKSDSLYFATALYRKCWIWSNDKPLKKQDRILVLTTKEILEILNKY